MNLYLFLPEVIIFLLGVLILLSATFIKNTSKTHLSVVFPLVFVLFLTLLFTILLYGKEETLFSHNFTVDNFAWFFKIFLIGICIITLLLSIDYLRKQTQEEEELEFYALILFSTCASMFIVSATDLITIYLSLEFLSITSYILAGYQAYEDKKSAEAAIKYFLLGAFCSCFMLYGFSLLYAQGLSTNIYVIAKNLTAPSPLILLSLLFILCGFCFKIALVPFHLWCPDTYEGAPTPITAYLSVAPKVASFCILIRLFLLAFEEFHIDWMIILSVISALSMSLGNLVALIQTNIKRMLAYSSIAQAGYILMGVVVGIKSDIGIQATLVYLIAYIFMNLGAFTCVIIFANHTKSYEIKDYCGLSLRCPFLAALLTIFLFSLIGIPPFSGFLGKLYVFAAVIEGGILWLAIVAIINCVISAYYYLNVVKEMYLNKPEDESIILLKDTGSNLSLAISAIITIGMILIPPFFTSFTRISTKMMG